MVALAAQQRALAAAIAGDDMEPAAGLLRPTPQGKPPRIEIYRYAYRSRLTDALRENYPVLHRLLGDDGFAELSATFIAAFPSLRPSIRWFGEALAEFLDAHPEHAAHPATADLARMEWALGTAFDAADAAPLASDALLTLAASDWPALRFVAHPSLRLLPLQWNVEPLWSALSADENAATLPPPALDHGLLVWRHNGRTQWRSIADDEASILAACLHGESFASWCAGAAARHGDDAALRVAGYLRSWLDSGLLTDIEQGSDDPTPFAND